MKSSTKSNRFVSLLKLTAIILLVIATGFVVTNNRPKEVNSARKIHKLDKVCKAGKEYTITSLEDLWNHVEDLHCIFHLGWEPRKVPEGQFYGEILSVGESYILNPLIRATWMGKLVTKVQCQGNNAAHLGWNYFAGPFAPFVATLGPLKNITHTHSIYSDHKAAVLFDYTPDLKEACPEINKTDAKNYPVRGFSPWGRNTWPMTQMTDILRPVGKQEDGGIIYLGQMYVVNIYRQDRLTTPVCFFAAVNYDKEAVPLTKHGDSLESFKADFHYRREGFLYFAMSFFPSNFLNEPLHMTKTVFQESWLFVKHALPLLKDFAKAPFNGAKKELEKRMTPPHTLEWPMRKANKSSKFISMNEIVHSHRYEL